MQDPYDSWNTARLGLLHAQIELVSIIQTHLPDIVRQRPDLLETIICAPQHLDCQTTTISEMKALTGVFLGMHLDIESSSVDFRIPQKTQYHRLLLPRQHIQDEDRAEFFECCRKLLVEQITAFRIAMKVWTPDPSSIPPENVRIGLWQAIHPPNGFPDQVKIWTVESLTKVRGRLRRKIDTFEQKVGEGVRLEDAAAETFGFTPDT